MYDITVHSDQSIGADDDETAGIAVADQAALPETIESPERQELSVDDGLSGAEHKDASEVVGQCVLEEDEGEDPPTAKEKAEGTTDPKPPSSEDTPLSRGQQLSKSKFLLSSVVGHRLGDYVDHSMIDLIFDSILRLITDAGLVLQIYGKR